MNGGIDKDDNGVIEPLGKSYLKETEELEKLRKLEDVLFKAFNAPGRFRRRLIKRLFPEMVEVAKKLQDFYWK